MEQKIDYFNRKMNENIYPPRKSLNPQKKWVPYATFFIVVITIVVLMFIFFQKYEDIKQFFGTNTWSLSEVLESNYKIWQSVNISWTIFSDWDLVSYTHSIHTLDGDVLWLKSRNLNLADYQWNIQIQWTIEKLVWDIFVVEVNNISWEIILKDTWSLSTWKYIFEAWIFFDQDFFDSYSIENISDWKIAVKSLDNNQVIVISYFKCNTYNPDQNCRSLNETFSQTSEKDFTTSNGVGFYKLQSVSSWYFSNDNLLWYFINDVPESEIMKLADYIVLPNKTYVNDNIMLNISNICNKWLIKLEKLNSYELKLENNTLIALIKWNYQTWSVSCKIIIDPLSVFKAVLQDISLDQTQVSINNQWTVLKWDPKVKQFPISLEKTMEFVSSTRSYKIIFPSANISFISTNVQQDFGQLGVNCFTQMNVVSYPNKENLQTNPAIKIYECNIKNWFQESDQIILKKIWDRNFVVEIVDAAWIEFTNNINIQLE